MMGDRTTSFAVGDINGDGYVDVLVAGADDCNNGGEPTLLQLFLNDASSPGTFSLQPEAFGGDSLNFHFRLSHWAMLTAMAI